jgi:DNA-binding XRE family transcriptional regulator
MAMIMKRICGKNGKSKTHAIGMWWNLSPWVSLKVMQSLSRQHVLFGRNLKQARTSQKLTQEKLAEKCSISVSYLQQLEAGWKNPSIKVLTDLHKVLKLRSDLFDSA